MVHSVRVARLRQIALMICAMSLTASLAFAGTGNLLYVFLTPAQWENVEPLTQWAIPRYSVAGDTLSVKPLEGSLSDTLRGELQAANVDSSNYLNLNDARTRTTTAAWQEVTP
ncbi:MAG TPA: hypothetical protein ENH10_00795 [Bacteroidetes bacterium]|nr:hypothetical protein BMS3Bbin04_00914 [bacterium BMS3Bbin04]HDO64556.1 hypothetical protein [Bacteroidota bacterium]HEX03681.1 hypothetical protein [Bacteroidota bacterium]